MRLSVGSFIERLRQRSDSEHEQALLRFIIGLAAAGWASALPLVQNQAIGTLRAAHAVDVGWGIAAFAAGTLVWIVIQPAPNTVRRTLTLAVDPVLMVLYFVSCGKPALPFLFFFCWLPIDSGFRFGTQYLYLSAMLSLASLVVVVVGEPYWRNAGMLAIGVVLNAVLVTWYAGGLLGRLSSTNVRLAGLATRDPLTGLPNRRVLVEHTRRAMLATRRSGAYVASIFIDLDGFKEVNDQHGHTVGDRLLLLVSRRIEGHLRDTDMVARVGGDEFAITALCYRMPDDAAMVARRVLHRIREIRDVDGHAVRISASIGVAWYHHMSDSPLDADALLHRADNAMYLAKRAGKNRVKIVDEDGNPVASSQWLATSQVSVDQA